MLNRREVNTVQNKVKEFQTNKLNQVDGPLKFTL